LRHRYKDQPVSAVGERVAVYSEKHTKHTNALCGDNLRHKETKFLSSFLYNIDIIGTRFRCWVGGLCRNDYIYIDLQTL
jgi:hypothetical protein